MSIGWMGWAFKQDVNPPAKFVLVVLADHADQNGWCYPSIERMTQMTNYSDKTVRRHLETLTELGVISRWKNPNGPHDPRCYEYKLAESEGGQSDRYDEGSIPVTLSTNTGQSDHEYRSERPPNRQGTPKEPSVVFQTQDESTAEPVKVEGEKLEEPEAFDAIWQVLTAIFGEPTMKTGIKKRRLRVLELEAAKVHPSEIDERWVQCARRWSFTPSEATFIDRWDEFAPPKQPERNKPYYEGSDGKIYSRHNR